MRFTKQPIFAAALALFAVSAVVSWYNVPTAFGLVHWYGQISPEQLVPLTIDITYRLASVFGALAVVIWGVIAKDVRSAKWAAFALGLFGPFASIALGAYWISQGSEPIKAFFSPEGWELAADIAIWVEIVAVILFVVGLVIRKDKPKTAAEVSVNRFDPETGLPLAAPASAAAAPSSAGALSNMPTIALVLAFFVPLAGVIVGHISLNQMKQGLISSANQSTAKTATILGYVFIGLGFIFGIIFAVVYGIMLSNLYR